MYKKEPNVYLGRVSLDGTRLPDYNIPDLIPAGLGHLLGRDILVFNVAANVEQVRVYPGNIFNNEVELVNTSICCIFISILSSLFLFYFISLRYLIIYLKSKKPCQVMSVT